MTVGQEQRDSLQGLLILATPAIEEPIFRRTVILVLEHNPEGAVGVVLNRPSPVPIEAAVEQWSALACHPAVIFTGGPVDPESAIALARVRPGVLTEAPLLVGRIGIVDLAKDPEQLSKDVTDLRIFGGYAGWAAGQLESELYDKGWWVANPLADDLLSEEPNGLWHAVLARQDGSLAWYAHYPDDPDLN
ncbi:MAG: YqgE/AlgH family protein [Acidimicrobiales bacterium]